MVLAASKGTSVRDSAVNSAQTEAALQPAKQMIIAIRKALPNDIQNYKTWRCRIDFSDLGGKAYRNDFNHKETS